MPFKTRDHKMHIRGQGWAIRRMQYYRMVNVPPANLYTDAIMMLKDHYEVYFRRLSQMLLLLQHYIPQLWDELYSRSISWAEYMSVADMVLTRLEPVELLLRQLYDAGTRGMYSEDCDGYTAIKLISDKMGPMPPNFDAWWRMQREMGRSIDLAQVPFAEEIVQEMGAVKPATTLGIVQLYGLLTEVNCKYVEHAAFGDPMRQLVINNLLGGPLPMRHPGFSDPLWIVHQLQDLMTDVRCYCREA